MNSPTAITTQGRGRLPADFPGSVGLTGPGPSVGSELATAAPTVSPQLPGSVLLALGDNGKASSARRENSPFSLQKDW